MAKLFYVIGASGAGKDSLIDYVREKLPVDARVLFAHRYITRPAHAGGENHIALSRPEFAFRQEQGCFAMNWYSHDTYYGVGTEINEWLAQDLNVIVNGSREYLEHAASQYSELVPVLITADPDVLADRLFARGRESFAQVTKRVAHALKLANSVQHPALEIVENNDAIETAGDTLLQLVLQTNQEPCV